MRSVVLSHFVRLTVFPLCLAAIPHSGLAQGLSLRAESANDGLRLRVGNLSGAGSLFIYSASQLSAGSLTNTVFLQTNTPAGLPELLLPVPTNRSQRYYFAAFWPEFSPGTNMAYIPAGRFTMGSPALEPARYPTEGPLTEVTISRGFWIGKYEVTQGEFETVMGRNPSNFIGDPMRPVEQVEWHDAVAYCDAITERERAAGRLPSGYAYRLPTEAEWEYACRAGTSTAFHHGEALRSGMANFQGNFEYPPCGEDSDYCLNPDGVSLGQTAPVGSFPPNAWGLHDMHGNVYEWCADWWTDTLPGSAVTDPAGPAETAPKVIRGGGWQSFATNCRSAVRSDSNPIHGNYDVGFRVVLGPAL